MDWWPGGLAWMLVRVVRTRCRRCAVLVRVQCSWVRRCCVWRPINGMVRKKQLARHHGGGVREKSGRMRCRRKEGIEWLWDKGGGWARSSGVDNGGGRWRLLGESNGGRWSRRKIGNVHGGRWRVAGVWSGVGRCGEVCLGGAEPPANAETSFGAMDSCNLPDWAMAVKNLGRGWRSSKLKWGALGCGKCLGCYFGCSGALAVANCSSLAVGSGSCCLPLPPGGYRGNR